MHRYWKTMRLLNKYLMWNFVPSRTRIANHHRFQCNVYVCDSITYRSPRYICGLFDKNTAESFMLSLQLYCFHSILIFCCWCDGHRSTWQYLLSSRTISEEPPYVAIEEKPNVLNFPTSTRFQYVLPTYVNQLDSRPRSISNSILPLFSNCVRSSIPERLVWRKALLWTLQSLLSNFRLLLQALEVIRRY